MHQVIYSESVSLLQVAFWLSVVSLVLSIWVGYAAVYSYQRGDLWWDFRRSPLTRGAAAIFLFFVGIGYAFVSFQLVMGGSETLTVRLNDKQIVTEKCGSSQTCPHYVLEMQSDTRFYKLEIPENGYKKTKIHACYAVTYYSWNGLCVEPGSPYLLLSNFTRIESVACPSTD